MTIGKRAGAAQRRGPDPLRSRVIFEIKLICAAVIVEDTAIGANTWIEAGAEPNPYSREIGYPGGVRIVQLKRLTERRSTDQDG